MVEPYNIRPFVLLNGFTPDLGSASIRTINSVEDVFSCFETRIKRSWVIRFVRIKVPS